MQKMLKVIAVMTFLAAGVFIFSTDSAEATASMTTVESAESTRTLYRAHCASCHGNNGRSQTAKGRKLEADDLTSDEVKGDSVEKISRAISNGRGSMPGFRKKLSAAQIASIANYVKTL